MKLHCFLPELAFTIFVHDPLKLHYSSYLQSLKTGEVLYEEHGRIVILLKLAQFKEEGTLFLIGLS